MSERGRRALAAPAKLNLGLRVVGRRPDGYHELESVFVPLELADAVEVEVAEGEGVRLTLARGEAPGAETVPEGEENLASRAARQYLERAACRMAVHIRLDKRIPAGAGLGGGSSDAGAVLRALAELLPRRLPSAELEALALGLGADVPYFLDPRPAWVEGIGERRTALAGWPACGVLLVHPGQALATAEVFRAHAQASGALTPRRAGPTISRLRSLRGASATQLLDALGGEGWLRNDLEPSAVGRMPAVAELREEVEALGARAAGMSGSGPVVYGLFAEVDEAREARHRLKVRPGSQTWVTSTRPSPPESAVDDESAVSAWGVAKW